MPEFVLVPLRVKHYYTMPLVYHPLVSQFCEDIWIVWLFAHLFIFLDMRS